MSEPTVPGEQSGAVDVSELIPDSWWRVHRMVIDLAQARGIRFAVGGGLATAAYSGHWRSTKDMDLVVLPQDREAMIDILGEAGLVDYYDREAYDKSWIYRGFRDDAIVDIIWEMANHRAPADEDWLERGPDVVAHGVPLRLVPPEELLWAKMYIMQRDRCDWPDLLNMLDAMGPMLDWDHLLRRVGADAPVLGALLGLFSWLCPARAYELPAWLWSWVGVVAPTAGPSCAEDRHRIMLLDSREWFGRTPDGW